MACAATWCLLVGGTRAHKGDDVLQRLHYMAMHLLFWFQATLMLAVHLVS